MLRKLSYTNPTIPDWEEFSFAENNKLSEIALADTFIQDYLEYGIFLKSKDVIAINGMGETIWDLSITRLDPIFSKNKPIYSNVYTCIVDFEEESLIAEVHKWILKYCLKKYGPLLDYCFECNFDTVKRLSDLGPTQMIDKAISKELSITFRDRESRLLKRISMFIYNTPQNSDHWLS